MPRDSRASQSPLGAVTIIDLGSTTIGGDRGQTAVVDHHQYQWRPSDSIGNELPRGFELAFDCFLAEQGQRCFWPTDGCEVFIHRAAVAGLACLAHDRNLDAEHRNSYRNMFLIFQLVRKMQSHLDRKFNSARDLYVRPKGRGAGITHNLLPADLGLDSEGHGQRWSIAELIRRGRELVKDRGFQCPTNKIAIEYGVLAAAHLRPLHVVEPKVLPLVRMALFDIDSIGDPPAALLETVTQRLLKSVFPRDNEGLAQFEKRFFPGKSNLIKALADQRHSPGGELPHDQVRQAVLHLGWQSFLYMSSVLQAFCHSFRQTLPTPLTPGERRLFDSMYLPQPYFGGLPLLLLKERGGIIKAVIADLWDDPQNTELIMVLHRLLAIYAEVATNRRTADRRFKVKLHPRQINSILQENQGQSAGSSKSLSEIAERLAHKQGYECDYCDEWSIVVMSQSLPDRDNTITFELELRCECGRISKLTEVTVPGVDN